MKFHALLPVRDEGDIIAQNLGHLLTWADAIYIFDTGSVDETWDIVREFAARDKRVIPLRKDPVYFSETHLRGWMFHQARKQMRTGDWFLRVDADEFHHVPPPEFVRTRMRPYETIAYHKYYDFRLLVSEVRNWKAGRETLADRVRPIEERRRWYIPSAYSEPRLCRYRDTMQWPPTVSFPHNAGFVARERLPIRHYPHRDPVQLERRCRLRAVMFSDPNRSAGSFNHWSQQDWSMFFTPDDLPELREWKAGTQLPSFHCSSHLASPLKRATQRLAHMFLLPMLDALRPVWLDNEHPEKLPAEIVRRLEREMKCRGTSV